MKLSELFYDCEPLERDLEVGGLSFRCDEVKQGDLFFCLQGTKTDGHLFAARAESLGAVAIVAQHQTDAKLPHILVEDSRTALALAAARFYHEPAKKLKLIGVTGTNGKTTTTYILESILRKAGYKTGVIGTNAIVIAGERFEASMTTPDPIDFHRILDRMVQKGVTYVIMEVSAHALALRKMAGVRFAVSAFTNFSRDHLDFFGDMDSYFAAKAQLFTPELSDFCVLNVDDEKGRLLSRSCRVPFQTYGCLNPCDAFAIDLTMSHGGLSYVLNLCDDIATVKFALPGRFNMYNTLCAALIAGHLGIPIKTIVSGIQSLTKVDGRFNIINTAKCSIVVDFAHTDDGLANILTAIREFAPHRIITVFGCGGDRDREKRPAMGRIVSELSDFCFLTSDNPRSENPSAIIQDIAAGIPSDRRELFRSIASREEAILAAVEFAKDGDIVLVAGKGAEQYTEQGGIKIPYNDEQYILKLIEENRI